MVATRLLFCIVSIGLAQCSVVVKPDTSNDDISIDLTTDTRVVDSSSTDFENNGVYDNKWKINYKWDGVSLSDWYVTYIIILISSYLILNWMFYGVIF